MIPRQRTHILPLTYLGIDGELRFLLVRTVRVEKVDHQPLRPQDRDRCERAAHPRTTLQLASRSSGAAREQLVDVLAVAAHTRGMHTREDDFLRCRLIRERSHHDVHSGAVGNRRRRLVVRCQEWTPLVRLALLLERDHRDACVCIHI
eukprot:scaffold3347_cov75-Phaeocystis_antarctica.AAC.8